METTADDFNDIFYEPPETEYEPLLQFESQILSEVPHNDISVLTQRIKRSFLDYVRQGVMLWAVRRHCLYKRQYQSFEDYCKNALGRSHLYCKKIIQAAHVCLELIKSKFKILPTSVAQALPLVRFAKTDKYGDRKLEHKWQTVLDGHSPESITAVKIAETLDENPEDRAKQVRIGGKTYQLLQKKALAAGMTVSKYLERLIGGTTEPPENEPPEEEETELTPEKEDILEEAEAYFKDKPAVVIKKPSKSHQKAISGKNRSDKVSDSS